jgi:hypothetical protein
MPVPAVLATTTWASLSELNIAAKLFVGVPVHRMFEAEVRICEKALLWACERPPCK